MIAKVKADLYGLLAHNYDFIELCDDIRLVTVPNPTKDEPDRVKRVLELTNETLITKEELYNMYPKGTKCSKWDYTLDGDKEGLAIVIDKSEVHE